MVFSHLWLHDELATPLNERIKNYRGLAPRLTIYVSLDGSSYHAIYLHSNTTKELTQKMFKLPGFVEYLTNPTANVENNGFTGWSK